MPTDTVDAPLVATLLFDTGPSVVFPMVFVGQGTTSVESTMGGAWGSGERVDGTLQGWTSPVETAIQFLFLVALAAVGYFLYRGVAAGERDSGRSFEELGDAYARGEPTDDELDQRRAVLERDAEARGDRSTG